MKCQRYCHYVVKTSKWLLQKIIRLFLVFTCALKLLLFKWMLTKSHTLSVFLTSNHEKNWAAEINRNLVWNDIDAFSVLLIVSFKWSIEIELMVRMIIFILILSRWQKSKKNSEILILILLLQWWNDVKLLGFDLRFPSKWDLMNYEHRFLRTYARLLIDK